MINCLNDRENGPFDRTEEVINPEVRATLVGTVSNQVPWIPSAVTNHEGRRAIGKASMKRQPSRVVGTKEETLVTL